MFLILFNSKHRGSRKIENSKICFEAKTYWQKFSTIVNINLAYKLSYSWFILQI